MELLKLFKFFINHKWRLIIALSIGVLLSITYTFFLNHKRYLTEITVAPFYETTEDIGYHIEKLVENFRLKDLDYSELNIKETKMSYRRPLTYIIKYYAYTDGIHNKLINHTTQLVDSINVGDKKSYEERKIIGAKISRIDELISKGEFCNDSINLQIQKVGLAMELENNLSVNYNYSSSPQVVSQFNWGIVAALVFTPLMIALIAIKDPDSN